MLRCKSSWVAGLVVLVACGSDPVAEAGRTTEPGPGEPMNLEGFCSLRASLDAAWCEYVERCCSAEDQADAVFHPPHCLIGPKDPAACVDVFGKLIDEGEIVFEGTWAQSCIDEQARWIPSPPLECSGLHLAEHWLVNHSAPSEARIPACRKTLVGWRREGETCAHEFACPEGMRCEEATSSGSTPSYTCQKLALTGSECTTNEDCVLGDFCSGKDPRTCGALGGGAAACTETSQCEDGYLCASDQCTSPRGPGVSCKDNRSACEQSLVCDPVASTCSWLNYTGMLCEASVQCEGRCDSGKGKCVDICGGMRF